MHAAVRYFHHALLPKLLPPEPVTKSLSDATYKKHVWSSVKDLSIRGAPANPADRVLQQSLRLGDVFHGQKKRKVTFSKGYSL